jgi:hypothetical protein
MVKLARVGCVIFPMIITLGGIVTLLAIVIGGQKKDIDRNNYWLKVDTRWVTDPDMRKKWPVDKKSGFKDYPSKTKAAELGLADFYTVGLWNTCEGKFKVDKDDDKPIWKITKCNKAKGDFYFDMVKILKQSSHFKDNSDDIPKRIQDAKSLSKKLHKVVLLCYLVAVIASIISFLVGWFGLFSRWGSCVTLLFVLIAMGTTFAASLMATLIFQGYRGAFRLTRSKFGVDTQINGLVQALAWIAFAITFVASFFWIFSSCCCSGKRDKIMGKEEKRKQGKDFDDGDSIMGSASVNSSSNRVNPNQNPNASAGQQGLSRSSFESQNLGPAMVPASGATAPQYAYSNQMSGQRNAEMPITPGPLHPTTPGLYTPGVYQDFNTAKYTEQPPLRNPRGPFEAYRT